MYKSDLLAHISKNQSSFSINEGEIVNTLNANTLTFTVCPYRKQYVKWQQCTVYDAKLESLIVMLYKNGTDSPTCITEQGNTHLKHRFYLPLL